MGWGDISGHEGWDAAVFAGDRVSTGSGGGGAMVRPVGPDGRVIYTRGGSDPEIVDGRESIGWKALCECGWAGVLRESALKDRDQFGDAPAQLEEEMRQEWLVHARAFEGLAQVREEARAVVNANERLDAAVATARADGSTWDAIGKAVGITRQSAHERWGSGR